MPLCAIIHKQCWFSPGEIINQNDKLWKCHHLPSDHKWLWKARRIELFFSAFLTHVDVITRNSTTTLFFWERLIKRCFVSPGRFLINSEAFFKGQAYSKSSYQVIRRGISYYLSHLKHCRLIGKARQVYL